MDLRVGGVDLQLVHLQPLAVRLHPGVHHHRLGTGHLVPVQLDGEREGHSFPLRRLSGLSRPVHCRGPVFRFPCWSGRFHGAHGQELLREFPPAEMELRVPQFLRLSGRSAVLGGAVSLQGGAVRRLELPGHPAAALHRIEQVCPGWGGDDILRSNGDPVRPLCPADILHIVVLHRRPQAGREGHRRGQLPQDRTLAQEMAKAGEAFTITTKAAHTPASPASSSAGRRRLRLARSIPRRTALSSSGGSRRSCSVSTQYSSLRFMTPPPVRLSGPA